MGRSWRGVDKKKKEQWKKLRTKRKDKEVRNDNHVPRRERDSDKESW